MKGQASVEIIMGFAVLLVLFAIVLTYSANVQGSAELLDEKAGEQKECLKLAYLISRVYAEGKGTQLGFELEKDATVFASQRTVKVGQQYCGFLANSEDRGLLAGEITLYNTGSEVVFG